MTRWRTDMENAPKDGTKILAINNRNNCAVIAWGAAPGFGDGWVVMFSHGVPHPFWNGVNGSVPKAWQHLPPPPQEKDHE